MKKLVLLLMFSLFGMIPCSSQTISNDSVYVMTAEELKLTNQIFAEHEYLTEKVELMEREILTFNTLVSEYEKEDSIKAQIIKNQETSIKKLKFLFPLVQLFQLDTHVLQKSD